MALPGNVSPFMEVTTRKRRFQSNFPVTGSVGAKKESCKFSVLSTGKLFPVMYCSGSNYKFYSALARKKESRKRNLFFHLPAAISCSPNLRLFQTDSSYITLGDIYDRHCEESGITREDPILFAGEKVKKVLREFRQSQKQVRVGPEETTRHAHCCVFRSPPKQSI